MYVYLSVCLYECLNYVCYVCMYVCVLCMYVCMYDMYAYQGWTLVGQSKEQLHQFNFPLQIGTQVG